MRMNPAWPGAGTGLRAGWVLDVQIGMRGPGLFGTRAAIVRWDSVLIRTEEERRTTGITERLSQSVVMKRTSGRLSIYCWRPSPDASRIICSLNSVVFRFGCVRIEISAGGAMSGSRELAVRGCSSCSYRMLAMQMNRAAHTVCVRRRSSAFVGGCNICWPPGAQAHVLTRNMAAGWSRHREAIGSRDDMGV